jgi:hypothetical protein
MTQSKPPVDDPLETAFAAARQAPPPLPDGLLARVLADAAAHVPVTERQPFWKQVVGALGGWPAMAGLAMTACVGVWAGGVLTDDLMTALSPVDAAGLDLGAGLGAFDLLLVDG